MQNMSAIMEEACADCNSFFDPVKLSNLPSCRHKICSKCSNKVKELEQFRDHIVCQCCNALIQHGIWHTDSKAPFAKPSSKDLIKYYFEPALHPVFYNKPKRIIASLVSYTATGTACYFLGEKYPLLQFGSVLLTHIAASLILWNIKNENILDSLYADHVISSQNVVVYKRLRLFQETLKQSRAIELSPIIAMGLLYLKYEHPFVPALGGLTVSAGATLAWDYWNTRYESIPKNKIFYPFNTSIADIKNELGDKV